MAGNTVQLTFAGDSKSLERTFANVGSSAKTMASDLQSAEGKAKSFGGAMDAAGGAADASEGKFMGAADLLDGLGGAFGLPTEGATGLMRSFGDLSGGFSALSPMVSGLGGILKTGLAPALSMIAAHPIIFTLAALAAAFVLLWKNSETFRDIVTGVFNKVGEVAGAIFNGVRAAIEGVFNWVRDNWKLVLGFLTGPIGAAVLLITTHWDKIKEGIVGVWEFIKSIPSKLDGIAGTIKDALTAPFRAAFNAIAGLWNNTVGKVSFEIPSWVPGLGGKGFKMPTIPEFRAFGGPVSAGSPYIVGERGPELFVPGRSGAIVPGAGAAGITVNFGVVGDPAAAARMIIGLLQAEQRRSGSLGF